MTVPKHSTPDVTVPISAEPLPSDKLPEPRASFSLALPGFAAAHVKAAIKPDGSGHVWTYTLHISGKSQNGTSFSEVLSLPPAAVVSDAMASLANGMFSFAVPLAKEPVSPVAVSSAWAYDESADARWMTLYEAALPGLSAEDVKAELQGRTLTLSSVKPAAFSRHAMKHATHLPAVADAEHLGIALQNGLLSVKALPMKRRAISLEPAQPMTPGPAGAAPMAVEAA